MGVLRRMGKSGDIPTHWSIDDEGSIQVARERFDDAIKNKMLAFNMDEGEGSRISAFDPKAKEIVLIPQIAGGAGACVGNPLGSRERSDGSD